MEEADGQTQRLLHIVGGGFLREHGKRALARRGAEPRGQRKQRHLPPSNPFVAFSGNAPLASHSFFAHALDRGARFGDLILNLEDDSGEFSSRSVCGLAPSSIRRWRRFRRRLREPFAAPSPSRGPTCVDRRAQGARAAFSLLRPGRDAMC
jgi:hypothetical protein